MIANMKKGKRQPSYSKVKGEMNQLVGLVLDEGKYSEE
tara:strand:+ start:375 stop:488 length:114 start_codon:yes stop_codon:yes gene_type:complete